MKTAIITLCFLLCLVNSQEQDNHILLTTEQTLTRHMEGGNLFMDFKFIVETVHPNQDLLFFVNPLDWISNPEILISRNFPYPRAIEQLEYLCAGWGADVCPISASQLVENQVYYVTVFCPYTCSFTIGVQYEPEIVIKLNEKKPLVFSKEGFAEGKIIKLPIPADINTDHILIQAIPKDVDNLNHTIGMYFNRGDIAPSASYFMAQGLPAWHGGVSFSLKSDMPNLFCTGCTYTILITSQDDVVVDLLARETASEVQLQLKTKVYDFMFENQALLYYLEIDSTSIPDYQEKDINIELRPYTGNPDLFVNLNERPADLNAYEWISNEYGIEALRITPEDRAASRNGTHKVDRFYIAVSNPIPSTFSLMAYLDNKNGKPLAFGTAETGYAQQQELETYTLAVPAQTEGNYQMTISLHVFSGNPDLYVKSCPNNFNLEEGKSSLNSGTICQVSQEDIDEFSKEEDSTEKISDKQFFIYSKRKTGNDQVVFTNGPPACMLTTGKCIYAVGVHGNSETPTSSRYSVLASHSQVHTVLQELIPIKHTIQIDEYRYYKFTLPDDTNVLSVHFQLTPISGAAGLYGAKGNQYPTKDNWERVACFCAHILTYCGFNPNDTPLKGTYYLAVYGYSHATYTITPIIRSSVQPFVIQLMEGVPHKFVFPKTGPSLQKASLRFRVDVDPNQKNDLHINLTPLKGGPFKLLLSEGFIPESQTAAWSSINNKMIISSKDADFTPNGNYFLSVVPYDPKDPSKTDFDTKNWQFTVQYYYSSNNIAELVEGHMTTERLSAAKPVFFRFAVNKDDKGAEVKVTRFGKALKLYASTDSENPYPTSTSYDYSGKDSIKFTKDSISKFCKAQSGGQITGSYCPIYVGVYADETEEAEQEFNIMVRKDETIVYLQEGLPDSFRLPSTDGYADYAIIPKRGEDIHLSLTSKVALKVFVTVYDTKAHPHSFEWMALETEDTLVKDQEDHYGETKVKVKASRWAGYDEAIVIIRIKCADVESAEVHEDSFTVTYRGNVNYLMDSHVIFGRVEGGSYNHYRLNAGNNPNKPLKVFLTPLTSGFPELYLSNSQSNAVPTKDNYQYKSQDPSSPSITLETSTGSYYLSVYSPNNCSYSLVFTTLPETLLNIKAGVPVTVTTNSKHEDGIYLVYAPADKRRDFKVLYSKEAGNPDFFLASIKENKEGDAVLPSPEDYQVNPTDEGYISIQHQTKYDETKEYLIFVKNDRSQTENKATVLISEKDQYTHLPSGKSFKDKVNKGATNYYYYVSQDLAEDEHVEISLVVYDGNPKLVASTTHDINNHAMWTASMEHGRKGSSIVLKILRENLLPSSLKNLKEDKPILAKGQTLFFGVIGANDASSYSIKTSVGKRSNSLEDGIISTGLINGKENKTFTFHSPYEVTEDRIVTLTLTILNENKNGTLLFPDIEISYVPENIATTKDDPKANNNRYIEPHVEQRRSFTTRVYRFIARKALYLLTLSMSVDISLVYSINLNVNGLVVLPPNNEMLGFLSEGNSDIYQINVREPGNLLIQFFECFGNSTVTLLTSLDDEQNVDVPQPIDGNGYGLVKVETGVIYLKVTTTKGLVMFSPLVEGKSRGLEAAYKLSIYFMPSTKKISHQYLPGNRGKIEAKHIGEGKYHLEWDNIQMPNAKQDPKNDIEIYEVIYASRSLRALDMAAKCQLIPGSEFVFTIEHGEDMKVWSFPNIIKSQEKTVSMDIDLNTIDSSHSRIYTTVTARIQSPSELDSSSFSIPVPVFYSQVGVYEGSSFQKFLEDIKNHLGTIMISAGIVIVILLGLICGFKVMKKGKKTPHGTKNVQYELGKMEEESPVKTKGYTGFREEHLEYEQSPATKKTREYIGLADDSEEHSPVRISQLQDSYTK